MKIQILASDADLVRGALRDEPGAFEELVLRHQRKAQAVALAIGVKPQSVEDVLQGSFLRAFRELSGLQEPASFGSWLLAIVRNEAREHLRSAARGSFEALPEGIESAPGESLEARDFHEFLWRKVGELPEGVREAVFLYYHEGRSVRNVARTLQVSPSAVKNRLMAGRDLLRGRLWTEMARCFEGLLPPRREWRRRGRRLALVAMMAAPGSLPGPAKAAAIESASISSGGFISALFQGVLIMAAKKTAILSALVILGVLGGLMFLPVWFQGPGGTKSPVPDLARRAEEGTGAPSEKQEAAVKSREVPRALPRAGIAGTVTFEESGAPAAGARVAALVNGERELAATAVTDENGRYEIVGLPPRKYLVLAWKDAWATEGT